ncbi:D-tyrosyl-tRNA(Tyr) deacylase [Candidatus Calescamantes bacterium]|nr:D-tyrosyl-tRNA(Tyr) deacylase [Candidatus Calescamantes bacterium]
MRAVIQRVSKSRVTVEGKTKGEIGKGLLVLLGIKKGDTEEKAVKMGKKIANLRIFEDERGKMNLSLKEIEGEVLLVSQFTLYGDALKGRRPSFEKVAPPEQALSLYQKVREVLKEEGIVTKTGEFGARMEVELINQGPVTIIVEI